MSASASRIRSIAATARRRALLAAALACGLCWLTGCGGGADPTAVRVGGHAITTGEVEHWISVLKGRGGSASEPGPPAPLPPHYTACIAHARAHPVDLNAASGPAAPKQPRAYCEFEYRRYKLKALYLLISDQWVKGEAAELGVRVSRAELMRDLAVYRKALGLSNDAAYRRYLSNIRADTADLLQSYEDARLTQAIEAKVAGAALSPAQRERALAQFGRSFLTKWLARTDCRPRYLVPICRQYIPGRSPAEFVPPTVPLTDMPNGR